MSSEVAAAPAEEAGNVNVVQEDQGKSAAGLAAKEEAGKTAEETNGAKSPADSAAEPPPKKKFLGVIERRSGCGRVYWEANGYVNSTTKYLGSFSSPEEAATTYDTFLAQNITSGHIVLGRWNRKRRYNFPERILKLHPEETSSARQLALTQLGRSSYIGTAKPATSRFPDPSATVLGPRAREPDWSGNDRSKQPRLGPGPSAGPPPAGFPSYYHGGPPPVDAYGNQQGYPPAYDQSGAPAPGAYYGAPQGSAPGHPGAPPRPAYAPGYHGAPSPPAWGSSYGPIPGPPPHHGANPAISAPFAPGAGPAPEAYPSPYYYSHGPSYGGYPAGAGGGPAPPPNVHQQEWYGHPAPDSGSAGNGPPPPGNGSYGGGSGPPPPSQPGPSGNGTAYGNFGAPPPAPIYGESPGGYATAYSAPDASLPENRDPADPRVATSADGGRHKARVGVMQLENGQWQSAAIVYNQVRRLGVFNDPTQAGEAYDDFLARFIAQANLTAHDVSNFEFNFPQRILGLPQIPPVARDLATNQIANMRHQPPGDVPAFAPAMEGPPAHAPGSYAPPGSGSGPYLGTTPTARGPPMAGAYVPTGHVGHPYPGAGPPGGHQGGNHASGGLHGGSNYGGSNAPGALPIGGARGSAEAGPPDASSTLHSTPHGRPHGGGAPAADAPGGPVAMPRHPYAPPALSQEGSNGRRVGPATYAPPAMEAGMPPPPHANYASFYLNPHAGPAPGTETQHPGTRRTGSENDGVPSDQDFGPGQGQAPGHGRDMYAPPGNGRAYDGSVG